MITRYFYRNPQIVMLIAAAIFVAGVSSLSVMPRLEDPILKKRVGVISASLVGANASEIETSVVVPIEGWLQEFSEIEKVRSNTRANVTNIVIELAGSVSDPDQVWPAIQRKLQSNANQLPDETSAPDLTVFPLKAYAAILAIVPTKENGGTLGHEFRLAKELRQRILSLAGSESVDLFGDPHEELIIEVDPQTLAETGLSTGMIAQQILNSEAVPGGNLQSKGRQLTVQLRESGDVIQRLEKLQIEIPGSPQSIVLSSIAAVSVKAKSPPSDVAIIDGQKSIVIGVMVDNGYRVDQWTEELEQILRQLSADFPGDYEVESLFLQSDQIQQRMNNLLQNIAISTVSVVLIVFLFMGWRCMLVVAGSLPLSACLVILGLRLMSIPIHQMSVTGLIVSLGLLIDNAIVMVEEIRSRIFQGKSNADAISESIRHLGLPLFGSTLTTALAFLPIAIMPGPSGEFVGALAVSVILAISSSLLLSLTIIPPLVFMLGVDAEGSGFANYGLRPGFLKNLYRGSLRRVFKTPLLGVLLGIALPCCGFYFAGQLQKQFFPATDRGQVQIELELSGSNNLDSVEQSVRQVMAIVENQPSVTRQNWFLGRSAPTFYYNVVPRRRSTPNYAQAFVELNQPSEIDGLVNQLQSEIDANIFDCRVVVRKLEQGPPFDAPIEVRVVGDDLQQLERLGDEIRLVLSSHPNVTHTRSDLGDKTAKLEMEIDANLAKRNGISENELSKFLYSSLEGADAGSVQHRGGSIPSKVVVNYADRSVIDTLLSLNMITKPAGPPKKQSGPAGRNAPVQPQKVSLGSIGDFELGADVGAIIRLNGQRVNEVKAYLQAGVLPSEALERFKSDFRDSKISLPQGYEIQIGGEEEKRTEAISTLAANLVIIIVLIVITLVAVLGKVRFALIIAAVAGLAIGLGPFAIYLFGYPLGFMAIVGTMGLVGVAINDSIVVLAAIREYLEACEHDDIDASKLAEVVVGSTRHILATTLTTMIGFLPLVLDGGKFWPPLAIVISAGVGGATLLALYFTPSLFLVLHKSTYSDRID